MPIDIAITTTAGVEHVRVENTQRSETFPLHVADPPVSVAIDPDRWILRGDVLTGTSRTPPSFLAITALSPNPAQDAFTLQYRAGETDRVDVEVFDVAGRRVLSRRGATVAGAGVEIIDTSALAAGVYFLRLHTNRDEAIRKFVVVR
jgi:hypothetical protein